MATVTIDGHPVRTSGAIPQPGDVVDFCLADQGLADKGPRDYPGRKVLNIFPSIDTSVCASSVRTFNQAASDLPGVTVLNVSADLPFAQKRFCGVQGLTRVQTLSTFRADFLERYGLRLMEGPLAGLAARAVLVLDHDGTVLHSQLVPDLGEEPDYGAALAAAQG